MKVAGLTGSLKVTLMVETGVLRGLGETGVTATMVSGATMAKSASAVWLV